ncbi:MAG: glycosyltransferase [Candidatus Neomarinimicrobiota bacterium]|nr:glycosyltransferase [Candidatus Neomarinimicrobiota bacterium]
MIVLSILISISYCVFFIWLAEGLRKSSKLKIPHIDQLPSVSIIIAARNEEENIPKLLNALSKLTYPEQKLEIIISNDRSSDKTEKLLRIAENEIFNLKVINIKSTPIDWAPKKWALQKSIEKAKNDIILQTDADCYFNPEWVHYMVSQFNNPTVGFIAGPAPTRLENSFQDKFALMDSLAIDAVSASTLKQNIALSCVGRNIAFRKSAFFDINGYDGIQDQISGDDDLLLQKFSFSKKYSIDYIADEKSVVNSLAPQSVEEFTHQRLRFASKGLNYYNLNTNNELKVILPFIYIVNVFIVLSITTYTSSQNIVWLLPYFIKTCSDALLTITFFNLLRFKWSLLAFFTLSIIHPFYVTIFAAIAPFYRIKWKS